MRDLAKYTTMIHKQRAMMHPLELPEFESPSQVSFGKKSPLPQPRSTRIFLCNSDTICDPSKKNPDNVASRVSRLYDKFCCRTVKRNARSRKVHHHDSEAAGDDAAVDRASTPVFGECLRGAAED